jgi:molybdopterin-guanine dinucleotide biosynthesis protein A
MGTLAGSVGGRKGVSGVILAGGASRRMGQDKAFLEVGGQPLIAIVAERLRAVTSEVIVAANDTARYAAFGDRCVPDVYPGVGTLGGIHAGLRAAAHDLVLVVACDMPFLNPDLLAWFVDTAGKTNGGGRADLIVLKHEDGVEPLHAVYRRSCLPAIEATIRTGERCAFAFYDQIVVRYVSPAEIATLDPTLRSFRNLNTPDQWHEVLVQVGKRRSLPLADAAGLPGAASCSQQSRSRRS